MTKAEFIEVYAEKTGLSKAAAGDAINAFFDTVAEVTKKGERIVFPGQFKAEVSERAARTGRNPQTGEEMQIPAKKTLKVKFSDKLL